jgi:hypothetical protein
MNLPTVLADRTMVHQPTGKTPFFMVYGREAVLPVELKYPTWRILDWEKVDDRASLLATRAQQLRLRDEDMEEIALRLRDEDMEEIALRKRRKRIEGKEVFDNSKQIRPSEMVVGDTVLRHNAQSEVDMSSDKKLVYKWLGAISEKGTSR